MRSASAPLTGGHDNITVVIARFDGDLPAVSSDDEPVGYHAFVLSESVESPIVGSASAALKVPALPPPGSDVKKAHSYPPQRDDRTKSPADEVIAVGERDDDSEVAVLPVSRTGIWVGWLAAAVALVLLAFGAWKLSHREPSSAAVPAPVANDAPPVTPLTPNGGTVPTLVPAPSWGDAAGAQDAGALAHPVPPQD